MKSRNPPLHRVRHRISALLVPFTLVAVVLTAGLTGCASTGAANKSAPVPVVSQIDLNRYMGAWYIVGAIGLGLEEGAHNAVETYTMNPDGSIATVFQFRKDSFDGMVETKVTQAWVQEGSGNAEWRVRTFWPLKQQYLISHVEPDYSAAIVARESRDYVWILSRRADMDPRQYAAYVQKIAAMGYDTTHFKKYPHDGRAPDSPPLGAVPPR